MKALFRRAQARFELRNLDAALGGTIHITFGILKHNTEPDLDNALQIEPHNDAVKAELKRQLAFAVKFKAEKVRKSAKAKVILSEDEQPDVSVFWSEQRPYTFICPLCRVPLQALFP